MKENLHCCTSVTFKRCQRSLSCGLVTLKKRTPDPTSKLSCSMARRAFSWLREIHVDWQWTRNRFSYYLSWELLCQRGASRYTVLPHRSGHTGYMPPYSLLQVEEATLFSTFAQQNVVKQLSVNSTLVFEGCQWCNTLHLLHTVIVSELVRGFSLIGQHATGLSENS